MTVRAVNWVFWSTRDSINRDSLSVTAILETVVAVPIYWWLAIHFETYLPLVVATIAAPFVLLRSDESVRLGLRWFNNFEKLGWPDSEVELDESLPIRFVGWVAVVTGGAFYALVASLLVRYLALGTESWVAFAYGALIGWILVSGLPALLTLFEFARVSLDRGITIVLLVSVLAVLAAGKFVVGWEVIGGIFVGWSAFLLSIFIETKVKKVRIPFFLISLPFAAGVPIGVFIFSIVARTLATLRYVWPGMKNLSKNFFRLTLCTSPCQIPELVPGLDGGKSVFTLAYSLQNLKTSGSRLTFESGRGFPGS